ncbi:MAG TPA: hypothetical protein VMB23_06065 [Spirochaetia bacterium]|nr:hypothetical protein [Spirochaetia bacterium]
MKPVVTRFYAVLVALAVVGLIAWSVADWFQLRQKAEDQGRVVLRQAAGLVSDRSLRPATAAALPLPQIFSQYPGPDPRWKTLVLWSSEGVTEFYRGPQPAEPIDKAIPQWDPRPLTEVRVSIPVFRADGSPLTLEGIYEFYGRAEIFEGLKSCGLTLLVLLVLTVVMVFVGRTEADPREEGEPDTGPGPTPSFETAGDDEEDRWPSLDATEEDHSPATEDPETDEEYWFEDELTLEDLPPLQEPAPPAASAPSPSLFSPDSGLGWETFLETRLAFELERSTAQNQDLSVILLAWKEGSVDPAVWGAAVREAFPSVDLDFAQPGGAAVLLPGLTLDQALKAARSFTESADRGLGGVVVHAGVSSRTGRLVSAATLLAEAESARRRSLAGTVRVLGLKTDPDRYREHLASQPASA